MFRAKRLFLFILAVAALVGVAPVAVSAKIVVLGGNAPGSLWYAQAQALAATATKHSDLKVDVLPQGATFFFPMFASGEVDMGMTSPNDALRATHAVWPYEAVNHGRGYSMSTVMMGSPNRTAMVTTRGSGINSMQDLKGKRVVADYGGFAASTISAQSLLANAGLSDDDISVVQVSSYPEGVRAVIEGRADAAVGSIGSGIVQELDASKGAKFLPIDPSENAMARVRKVGAWVPMLVKKGSTAGVNEDTYTLAYATTVVARPDLDDEIVAKFIDAIWNNYKELPAIHRSLSAWTPDGFANVQQMVVPFHPAAVKYYKQKGVWTAALEKRQKELLQEQKKKR